MKKNDQIHKQTKQIWILSFSKAFYWKERFKSIFWISYFWSDPSHACHKLNNQEISKSLATIFSWVIPKTFYSQHLDVFHKKILLPYFILSWSPFPRINYLLWSNFSHTHMLCAFVLIIEIAQHFQLTASNVAFYPQFQV